MFYDSILFYIIFIILIIAVYIYYSLSWSNIAKKLKYKKHWLAWVPIAQLFLYPILARKKWYYGFILVVPVLFLLIVSIFNYSWIFFFLGIINIFFMTWWTWNIFERLKFPGYLSLIYVLLIIPFIDVIATIAYLIIIGFVAFSKNKK